MLRFEHPAIMAAFAAAFSLSSVGPAAAAATLQTSKTAPVEVVGPAAKGDPKPFRTFVQAECTGNSCVANFGKKGDKVRTVEWISCGINTAGGGFALGQAFLAAPGVPVGFFSTVSRGTLDGAEIAVAEFKNTFDIPAGETMLLQLVTGGTAQGAQCVAAGTIK
jgi:hypothetical protein